MDIVNKEYYKYAKPVFFNFLRIAVYIFAMIILFGIFSRREESQFVFVNLFVFIIIIVVFVAFDAWIGNRKAKTYKSHKVEFRNDCFVFVDHKGEFHIPYEDMKSYQLVSDQITIKVTGARFVISGRQHGINIEEIKSMVDQLNRKKVLVSKSLSFIYFVVLFLVINYGADYVIINLLNLSTDASLFGTMYLCLVLGIGYYVWEYLSAIRFKLKEDKYV